MFIPNTMRRAARVVLTIAVVPVATQALIVVAYPSFRRVAIASSSFERVGENLLILAIAAGLSIFGVHVINHLRREAIRARRLNQYRLGRPLGFGGMGEVYLAEHNLLKRPCALKIIRPEKAADARSLARFEREVHALARLSHPNCVEIYDYGRADDGTFYYVMEYLPGRNLEELVERHGPMPPGRVIYLLRQACEALAEAHEAGLIHRDIKPANLFAARRGGRFDFMKVLDFGLVKDTDPDLAVDGALNLSREGTVRGTPLFLAPEQATGDGHLDGRADLYAIGGVAYYLLTGRPPFDAPTAASLLIAHARDPVVPPSRHNPNVPDDLETIVLHCLAKSPAERFADASTLAYALASCTSAPQWDERIASQWWARVRARGPGQRRLRRGAALTMAVRGRRKRVQNAPRKTLAERLWRPRSVRAPGAPFRPPQAEMTDRFASEDAQQDGGRSSLATSGSERLGWTVPIPSPLRAASSLPGDAGSSPDVRPDRRR